MRLRVELGLGDTAEMVLGRVLAMQYEALIGMCMKGWIVRVLLMRK